MSENSKSSTLPPNLRLKTQTTNHAAADTGSFFTRLKKRFRLRKGRYDVGVNTGECANVSVVSFKKRTPEDAEMDTTDFTNKPLHDRHSESPKTSRPSRSLSERYPASNIGTKNKVSKFPNLDFNRESPKSKSTRVTDLEKHPKKTHNAHLDDQQVALQGNAYSFMKYDKDTELKPLEIDKETDITNSCLTADDSAVDLDTNNERPHDKFNEDIDLVYEPGYESISDVKNRIAKSDFKSTRPKVSAVTQDINVDASNDDAGALSDVEPGYEAINDVKKRIIDKELNPDFHNAKDNASAADETVCNPFETFGTSETSSCHDIYAQSVKKACHSKSLTLQDSVRNHEFIDSALSLSVVDTSSTLSCTSGLTASGKSYDSGFDGKYEDTQSKLPLSHAGADTPMPVVVGKIAVHFPTEPVDTGNCDSDDELLLDPDYSECADAIKGFAPYAVSSEGSGSKLSSCTSLNMSVEDFTLEPGYAECVDAIKSGAIKKISVSHERLADAPPDNEHKSELYANPQILFRKRSRLLETEQPSSNFLLSNRHSAVDKTNSYDSLCSDTSQASHTDQPLEAPPLPARNYSLYLDSEEAKQEAPSPVSADGIETDDAFDADAITFDAPNTADCVHIDKSNDTSVDKHTEIGRMEIDNQDVVDKVKSKLQAETPAYDKCELVMSGNTSVIKTESDIPDSVKIKLEEIHISRPDVDSNIEEMNKCVCESGVELKADGSSVTLTPTSRDISPDNTAGCDACQGEMTSLSDVNCCMNATTKSDSFCRNPSSKHNDDSTFQVTVYENGNQKILTITEKHESQKVLEKRESAKRMRRRCSICKCFVCLCYSYSSVANDNEIVSVECDIRDKILDIAGCGNRPIDVENDLIETNKSKPLDTSPILATRKKHDACREMAHVQYTSTGNMFSESQELISDENVGMSHETGQCRADVDVQHNHTDTRVVGHMENNNFPADEYTDVADRSSVPQSKEVTSTNACSTGLCTNIGDMNTFPKENINLSVISSAAKSYIDNTNCEPLLHNSIDKLTCVTPSQDRGFINTAQNMEFTVLNKNEKDVCPVVDSDISFGDSDTSSDGFVKTEDLPKLEIDESQWDNSHIDDDQGRAQEITLHTDAMLGMHATDNVDYVLNTQIEDPGKKEAEDSSKDICNSRLNTDKVECETDVSSLCATMCHSDISRETSDSCNKGCVLARLTKTEDDHSVSDANDFVKCELSELSMKETDLDKCECFTSRQADTSGEISGSDDLANKVSWNHELPVLTRTLPSNLYEDTEPTHISFRELASLWSERNHGNEHHQDRLSSRLSDNVFHEFNSATQNPFSESYSDIPDLNSSLASTVNLSDISTPPPRPPLPALDQSDHGLSSSSQSNHSSGDTPPDDCFPNGQPFRFSSGGNQSDAADDDTPPVLPPRMKARKQQEAVASIHRDFMESMKQLKDCGWYWGPLSFEEAEAKLANKPVGSFLVRDSSNERYILSLSFRNHERVHHTRIEHHQGHFSFWSQPDSHGKSTIKDFVEQCVDNSRNGRFLYFIRPSGPGSPPLPVHLLHPVSRFIQMRSLQHMCRFRIVQLVRRDHIDCLPIPTRIKNYMKEAQYYVEYLDD